VREREREREKEKERLRERGREGKSFVCVTAMSVETLGYARQR
jgi:hypothetical protein